MPQRLLLEGGDIDELLLRVQNEHGPQARIVHAEQKLVGGIAGYFARRRYELAVQVDEEDLALPVTTQQPAPASSFDELLAQADCADGGAEHRPTERRSPRAPEWSADAPPAAAELPAQRGRQLSTQTPQFENLLSSLLGRAERPETSRRAGDGEPDIAAALAAGTAPSVSTAPPASVAALARLGLAADSLPSQPVDDARTALLDVLATLPERAHGRLWGVTVVVGPAELAERAVAAIVERTGGTGAEPIISTSDAPSAADLAVRASSLCSTNGAALVVVETQATRAAARRAGRLISGLGLGTVVAAVDATRDVGATMEWLAELGGGGRHVDEIAAFDVAESPTPLALLGLGPDIGWIDGRTASVGTWAAPCLDRLLSDGRAG